MANTTIQAVFIREHEERTAPKPHTVYKIEIQANVRSWFMWRRYSEFDDLNIELTKAVGAPPAPLPPKHKFSILKSHNDPKVLEERREGLENYLRAILRAKEDKWRDHYAFREFLGIPVGRQSAAQGSASREFTMASWLDEHIEIQGCIRDARADINKRDALSDRGDIVSSHKSNVSAKQKLASVFTRVSALEDGLKTLAMGGMNEGELQRRTDMAARLRDDCEKLSRMVTVARTTASARDSGGAGSGNIGIGSAAKNAASDSDREALLGGSKAVPAKPFGRIFGAKPQETEATRPLDDRGLFSLQQTQIERQDSQLADLATILIRQKQLGQAIGSEIAYQNELLDDLSSDVDRVGGKLSAANKQLNRLG